MKSVLLSVLFVTFNAEFFIQSASVFRLVNFGPVLWTIHYHAKPEGHKQDGHFKHVGQTDAFIKSLTKEPY